MLRKSKENQSECKYHWSIFILVYLHVYHLHISYLNRILIVTYAKTPDVNAIR